MLDGVFQYGNGFKGATGSRFEMVSKAEYKERMSKDNVIESILECGVPEQFARGGANAFIFNCSGGGRCFVSDFQGNVNPELSKIIREYESK